MSFVSTFNRKPRGLRRFFQLVLIIALLTAVSWLCPASQSSLPGETLYPLKILLENAALALAPGKAGEANLYIEFAQRRLIEIQSLVLQERYEYIPDVVTMFESQVDQAIIAVHRIANENTGEADGLATSLEETLSSQNRLFAALHEVVPPETKLEFDRLTQACERGQLAIRGASPGPLVPVPTSSTAPH